MNDRRPRFLEMLSNDETFKELTSYFLSKHYDDSPKYDADFEAVYREFAPAIILENSLEIDRLTQSPIERIFLRSILLGSIKNSPLSLLVHRIQGDTEAGMKSFRDTIKQLTKFTRCVKRKGHNLNSILEWWNHALATGAMTKEENGYLHGLFIKYAVFNLQTKYHMSLQPKFSNILDGGKTLRADLLFWIPSKPSTKIIIECDGFAYHSDKASFTNDRKRDRAFQAKGYKVFRFSGAEINKDPPSVAGEITQYLWSSEKAPKAAA